MMEWQISGQDIHAVEEILLPHGAQFPEDARNVIRCWHSTNVAACPGSGKTTVLLAKLKLLADRMPLENGAGICVLSHTNVAVNEIKNRLSDYVDRLLSYPNYIGTIQSFIDRFVTMPYLRNVSGRNVQVVDGFTYAQHTPATIKKVLEDKYREPYRQWMYEMSTLQKNDRQAVNQVVRKKINELLKINNPEATDIFADLPEHFLDESAVISYTNLLEKNVLIDPTRGRRIVFDTIHGVKGETHDATLYLETDRKGASDLSRILHCFGVGKQGNSTLYDYSRKLAYVGMSRPKKLLCVAMQAKTYEKAKKVFEHEWEIIDLRDGTEA